MERASARYGTWFQPAWLKLQELAPQRLEAMLSALESGGVKRFVESEAERKKKKPGWLSDAGPGWLDGYRRGNGANSSKFGSLGMPPMGNQVTFQTDPELEEVDTMEHVSMRKMSRSTSSKNLYSMLMHSGSLPVAESLYAPRVEKVMQAASRIGLPVKTLARVDQLAKDFLATEVADASCSAYFGTLGEEPLSDLLPDSFEGAVTFCRLMSGEEQVGWLLVEQCADAPSVSVEQWVYSGHRLPKQVTFEPVGGHELVHKRDDLYTLVGGARAIWMTRIGIQGVTPPQAIP
jgi:hypothetical protein